MRALMRWQGARSVLVRWRCGRLAWLLPASAVDVSPFEKLVGRWVGEGRLGVRDNATENVKCRVTYVVVQGQDQLKQTIRCASASGSIEVQSVVDARLREPLRDPGPSWSAT